MAFLGSLFGCSKDDGDKPNRYVGETGFRKNLALQLTMSPQTVTQLRKLGVTAETNLKLEFFFLTDKEAKGKALAKELKNLQYQVEYGRAAGDSDLVIVTGWTTPMKMSEEAVVAWTDKMCRLAYEHDCQFDGWGTNPRQ